MPHPALVEGLRHHQAGRLAEAEAEALYRNAPEARPDNPGALRAELGLGGGGRVMSVVFFGPPVPATKPGTVARPRGGNAIGA